jgi:putative transposase
MIDRTHPLSLTKQAAALGISRGSVYYQPQPVSERDQKLMNRIDRLHLECPFAGARMLRDLLNAEGFKVGRKHVASLMRKMGIESLYRKPKTTQRHPEHRVYPYRLRGLTIDRPNQVWAMDITYIPMARGFVYLTVVLDWYSRRVLAHRVSISMDTSFCLDALEEAIDKYGTPEIVNTDQGSQFTSQAFTGYLKDNKIEISMDGKGSWRDNVFVERLWRTVKYEHVYLHAYDSTSEAKTKLSQYFDFYNQRRPHSRLDRQTPDQVYFESLPLKQAA